MAHGSLVFLNSGLCFTVEEGLDTILERMDEAECNPAERWLGLTNDHDGAAILVGLYSVVGVQERV